MLKLLIARHGNTFDKGDTVLRVGRGTDLDLSQSGRQQAVQLGDCLKRNHPELAAVFTSTLKRTRQTASLLLARMGLNKAFIPEAQFDEIDYGPDEGKPEPEVIARLGLAALRLWEQESIVPDGWQVEPESMRRAWQLFGARLEKEYVNKTVLVVTSNGVARFAPEHSVKLSTGAYSELILDQGIWRLIQANRKPA